MLPKAAPPRGGEGREPDASHGARTTTDPRCPFQENIARACCLGVLGESSLRHGLYMEVDIGGEPGEIQDAGMWPEARRKSRFRVVSSSVSSSAGQAPGH